MDTKAFEPPPPNSNPLKKAAFEIQRSFKREAVIQGEEMVHPSETALLFIDVKLVYPIAILQKSIKICGPKTGELWEVNTSISAAVFDQSCTIHVN